MSVKLLHITPLWLISNAIRYSHDNHDKADYKIDTYISFKNQHTIGSKDFNLIKRVGFQMKHESVLEHNLIVFEFEASRALLQELSRHRISVSPTVKSTRYTLKELNNEDMFTWLIGRDKLYERASKYLYFVKDKEGNIHNPLNNASIQGLEIIRQLIQAGHSNDEVKYALPEAFKFKGQYSFNLRSLLHLLKLRIDKSALHEFRLLCVEIIDSLPEDYKELVLLDENIRKNYDALNEKRSI